jgi:hypothetical protein
MSEYRTGDPICNCRESVTGGKPWCPVHDNYTGSPRDNRVESWGCSECCWHTISIRGVEIEKRCCHCGATMTVTASAEPWIRPHGPYAPF